MVEKIPKNKQSWNWKNHVNELDWRGWFNKWNEHSRKMDAKSNAITKYPTRSSISILYSIYRSASLGGDEKRRKSMQASGQKMRRAERWWPPSTPLPVKTINEVPAKRDLPIKSQWPAPRNSRKKTNKTKTKTPQQNKLPAKVRQGQKQCTMKTLVKVETNANRERGKIVQKNASEWVKAWA